MNLKEKNEITKKDKETSDILEIKLFQLFQGVFHFVLLLDTSDDNNKKIFVSFHVLTSLGERKASEKVSANILHKKNINKTPLMALSEGHLEWMKLYSNSSCHFCPESQSGDFVTTSTLSTITVRYYVRLAIANNDEFINVKREAFGGEMRVKATQLVHDVCKYEAQHNNNIFY
ncbi:CLUMA_CG019667, isoform A [Clunio marinus]|uniref:CLUMA_CG019667, isoform A n=1 Tax=Clunio marinus TaxID=568069 RepID=A0A1J1J3G5_9DIPT|nr:CLUMA_CG019667, isoform A [Clunio marinus]